LQGGFLANPSIFIQVLPEVCSGVALSGLNATLSKFDSRTGKRIGRKCDPVVGGVHEFKIKKIYRPLSSFSAFRWGLSSFWIALYRPLSPLIATEGPFPPLIISDRLCNSAWKSVETVLNRAGTFKHPANARLLMRGIGTRTPGWGTRPTGIGLVEKLTVCLMLF
jgi:hypothetical protein